MTCRNGAPDKYCNCNAKPDDKVKAEYIKNGYKLHCRPQLPTKDTMQDIIDLAASGLKWPEHKDFARVWVALEKVHDALVRMQK